MASTATQHVDALIVGAGLGGIYQLYELRKLNLSVKLIEAAPDVGGTWYWNRYPGAMSDTESFMYRYSWDKEDLQTYPWPNHYVHQPEVLEYIHHVVRKHDLRKHMQFNTELLSADWDDGAKVWRIVTSTGETFITRYFVAALGILLKRHVPDIPGIDTFRGTLTHSSNWPEDLDVTDKRVGIIGCGSTGVQIVSAIAPKVRSLTSFIRHPQYSVPANNRPVEPSYRRWVNENYDALFEQARNSVLGFGFVESTRPVFSVAADERERIFEELWRRGNGFRFMFEGFGDIASDRAANEAACAFIRRKIARTVADPEKARKLTPREPLARRPICDSGYFEQFNRPNVDVVDIHANPIDAVTPAGVRTADGALHELDVLVLATGFDAVDGSYTRVCIRGRGGETIKECWADGPKSYMGNFAAGFPNMFMINGPQSCFANFPPILELNVEFVTAAVKRAEEARRKAQQGAATAATPIIEATAEAEAGWGRLCEELSAGSLFRMPHSWIFGANVPGKPQTCRFYMAGLKSFRERMNEVIEDGWRGFEPLTAEPSADIPAAPSVPETAAVA